MTNPNTPFTMKTHMIKTAFILAMFASGGAITLAAGSAKHTESSIHAGGLPEENEKPENIFRWIQKNVSCPDFVKSGEEHRIELWMRIDENQHIEVLNTGRCRKELADYVRGKLNGRVCPNEEAGAQYHFAINFKRLH